MDAFTCKTYILGQSKTPKKIKLLGDRGKPESAQHVIEFPGGAIEVSRTPDGNYWAHIIVNRHQVVDECKGRQAAFGEIVGSRITADNGVNTVPDYERIKQVAILIKPYSDAT